jgi:natural product precursor
MENERPEELKDFEVTELEDSDLEDVAGGDNTNCGCNTNCPCSPPEVEILA